VDCSPKKDIHPDDIEVAWQIGEHVIARQDLPRVVATKSVKYEAVSLALREVIIKHDDVLYKNYCKQHTKLSCEITYTVQLTKKLNLCNHNITDNRAQVHWDQLVRS